MLSMPDVESIDDLVRPNYGDASLNSPFLMSSGITTPLPCASIHRNAVSPTVVDAERRESCDTSHQLSSSPPLGSR
jgi:hypothetical protein